MNSASVRQTKTDSLSNNFALMGMAVFAIRLVSGFIMWGGASRRLFYHWGTVNGILAPIKMDPNSPGFVANKLLHAAPGSPLEPAIDWIVHQHIFLYVLVWVWTLAELFIGLGLIFGLLTRLSALGCLGVNVALMLLFGWMGSTCVDEWTMASSGFAMSATLMISGGGPWSLDHYVSRIWPDIANSRWMRVLSSGDIPELTTRRGMRWMGVIGLISLAFTMGFYAYYRGAVISPLGWRVSFKTRDIKMTQLNVHRQGRVTFRGYANQGPDTGWLYIVGARLVNAKGKVVEHWSGSQLKTLPASDLNNEFTQPWDAQFKTGPHGLRIKTGAKAKVTLPPAGRKVSLTSGRYHLELEGVSGKVYKATTTGGQ